MSQYDPQGSEPGQYPAERPSGAPAGTPRQVVRAVNLLYAIIALAVANLILWLTQPAHDSMALIASLGGIVSIVFFVWLTLMIRKGANWARIVITVLFMLGIIALLLTLVLPVTTLLKEVSLVQLVVQLAALVLLWRAPSSAYFAAHSRPA